MTKNHKKIIFISGWLHKASYYGPYKGLDIWVKNYPINAKIEADYVIGHSLGANFALINWEFNKDHRLILVNPLMARKNLSDWIFRWIKSNCKNPQKSSLLDGLSNINHLPSSIKKALIYFKFNSLEIIDKIPKENLTIIRGIGDEYLCDRETADVIKSKNIRLIEIDDAGHEWNKKFDLAINQIINN